MWKHWEPTKPHHLHCIHVELKYYTYIHIETHNINVEKHYIGYMLKYRVPPGPSWATMISPQTIRYRFHHNLFRWTYVPFLLQAWASTPEKPKCLPGFKKDSNLFEVDRRHLHSGRVLGKGNNGFLYAVMILEYIRQMYIAGPGPTYNIDPVQLVYFSWK